MVGIKGFFFTALIFFVSILDGDAGSITVAGGGTVSFFTTGCLLAYLNPVFCSMY